MAGSVRILKTLRYPEFQGHTGEEFDLTELERSLYDYGTHNDPPAQFHSAPMNRRPRNIHGLSPEEVMALLGANSELLSSEFPNPYELDLSQHGFSEPEFDPMQAHLDEEDARRKLEEGIEPPSRVFMSQDLRYPEFRGTSPRRYDDPPNPFKKSSPLDAAWALLKADPAMNIRQVGGTGDSDAAYYRRGGGPQTTMNPIIARLLRERNEREGRSYMGHRPKQVTGSEWSTPDDSSDYGLGDRYQGDYVARGRGASRDYNRRAPHWSTQEAKVHPDSDMAAMNAARPYLENLPEGLQPDWM